MSRAIRAARLRKIRNALHEEFNGECHYCQVVTVLPIEGEPGNRKSNTATVDHVVARAHGGTDSKDNLVLACLDCNNRRGIMPYEEFKAIRTNPEAWEEFKKNNSNIHRQLQGALTNEIRAQAKAIRAMKRAELIALDKKRIAEAKASRRLLGEIKHRHNVLLARECGHNGIRLLNAWINRANFAPRKEGNGWFGIQDSFSTGPHPWKDLTGDTTAYIEDTTQA